MEEKLRHFSAKKCQFGHKIQPLIFDVNIQHTGPYRLSRPWSAHKFNKEIITLRLKKKNIGIPLFVS